ncbi:MAG: hypothetical protein JO250_17690 [Armatimonadetes bacterium]|nr:hypothetical protein [Armatimonadota bacterium]
MELTETQEEYREWLIDLVLSANTIPEIAATREMLQQWMEAHPDDLGMMDGFDHLAMSQTIALSHAEGEKQAA